MATGSCGRRSAERRAQCALLRCVLSPSWLAWRGGVVVQLAEAVYEQRKMDNACLAILADELEDAGCDDVATCVSREGCYVLDALRCPRQNLNARIWGDIPDLDATR